MRAWRPKAKAGWGDEGAWGVGEWVCDWGPGDGRWVGRLGNSDGGENREPRIYERVVELIVRGGCDGGVLCTYLDNISSEGDHVKCLDGMAL